MNPSSLDFKSFSDFYPYYINEHKNKICKVLHFTGTCGVLIILIFLFITGNMKLLLLMPICGYGFAWTGHFFFEKNRPATFKYPFYSLTGDFVMFWHLLTGRLKFENNSVLH